MSVSFTCFLSYRNYEQRFLHTVFFFVYYTVEGEPAAVLDGNDPPNVNEDGGNEQLGGVARVRLVNEPIDQSLELESPIFRGRYREVSLSTLSQEDALGSVNLRRCYIDAQILRVITPNQLNRVANVSYRLRRGTGNRFEDIAYSRIYLCRVSSDTSVNDNSRLFYILQNKSSNKDIWNRSLEFRDNGTLTIGSLIRIPNPSPIEKFMQNVPLISTIERVACLKLIGYFNQIPINNALDGNAAMAFCYNGRDLRFNRFGVIATICTGLHCDGQRMTENRLSCGCYGNSPYRSDLVFVFGLAFESSDGQTRIVSDFSSRSFMKLFLNDQIPREVMAQMLQGTNLGMDLEDCIVAIIEFINEHDGFTVIGWIKRGLINDQSLVGNPADQEENRVHAEHVSMHVTQIIPTNRDLLDRTTNLGRELHALKFNVRRLVNGRL